MRRCVLHRFADCDAEAARRVRVGLEDSAAGVGAIARAGEDFRAPSLHDHAPVGLLVVAHAHHIDGAIHLEHAAGQSQRTAPLTGAGFRGQPADAFAFVVVGLGYGGVGFVTARRADSLVFVVNVRRRIERFLQPSRAIERRGPPQLVNIENLSRDVNFRFG
jgi:hypothetical protein